MSDRVFRDRREAGRVLAGLLDHYRGEPDVVVLGLARGGVPVAYEVARALGAPLGVFVVRKLGSPGRPELAMGAIASGGVVVIDDDAVGSLRVTPDDVRRVAEEEGRELIRREQAYGGERPRVDALRRHRPHRPGRPGGDPGAEPRPVPLSAPAVRRTARADRGAADPRVRQLLLGHPDQR